MTKVILTFLLGRCYILDSNTVIRVDPAELSVLGFSRECVPPIWEIFLISFISMFVGHSERKIISGNLRCVESELVNLTFSEVSGPLGGQEIFLLDFYRFFSGGSLIFFYSQKFWLVWD